MSKVQPRRIEARCQKEFIVLQHSLNEFDFDNAENDIPEITDGSRTPVLDNVEPVWTDA